MQWINGNEIDVKQYTGESLCEKMASEMWNCGCDIEQYLNWADFIQVAYFIIAFDTELTMEGIFTFLENSHQEYEITCFDEDHELKEEIVERIEELSEKLYLNTDFDIWELLFRFIDGEIAIL